MSRVKWYKDKQLQLAVEYFPIEGTKPWELLIKVNTGTENDYEFAECGTKKDLTQAQILDYITECLEANWEINDELC